MGRLIRHYFPRLFLYLVCWRSEGKCYEDQPARGLYLKPSHTEQSREVAVITDRRAS